MTNRFSVKTTGVLVILVYTFGFSFINFTFALLCFDCEGVTCDVGPIYLRKCQSESSVCLLFKDVTGRALKKGPGHVYRRTCGVATYPNNKTELNCTHYTANFDKCICRDDLCNGDESLLELTTTTRIYPPSTTESGEDCSGEDCGGVTTPGPDGNGTIPGGNITTPMPDGNGTIPGGNVTSPKPDTTPKPGVTPTTTRRGIQPAPKPTPKPPITPSTTRRGIQPAPKPTPTPPGGVDGNNGIPTDNGKPEPNPTVQKGRMMPGQGRAMTMGDSSGEKIRKTCNETKSKNKAAVLAHKRHVVTSGEQD